LRDEGEEAISGMVNKKIDIDTDDEMDLKLEAETVSEESSEEQSKVRVTEVA
jgi:hypothetical protein